MPPSSESTSPVTKLIVEIVQKKKQAPLPILSRALREKLVRGLPEQEIDRTLRELFLGADAGERGRLPPVSSLAARFQQSVQTLFPSVEKPGGGKAAIDSFCAAAGTAAFLQIPFERRANWKLGTAYGSIDIGGNRWWPIGGVSIPILHTTREAELPFETHLQIYFGPVDFSMTCGRPIENPLPVEATGLVVYLDTGRNRILSLTVDGTRWTRIPGPGVYVFDQAVAAGRSVELRARFLGDLPFVRGITWLHKSDGATVPPADPGEAIPSVLAAFEASDTRLLEASRTPQELRDLRLAADLEDPDRRLFTALDLETLPDTAPDPEKARETLDLAQYLQLRYENRAQLAAEGLVPVPEPAELELWRDAAVASGAVYSASLKELLPTVPDVERAFERFAGGELWIADSQGVPNGVYYFSFVEYAYLMRDLGVDTEFWEDRIPALARSAEIFVRSFHVLGEGRTVCAYRAEAGAGGRRAFDAKEKAALKARWDALSPGRRELEFGRLIASALADDPVMEGISFPNPMSLPDTLPG